MVKKSRSKAQKLLLISALKLEFCVSVSAGCAIALDTAFSCTVRLPAYLPGRLLCTSFVVKESTINILVLSEKRFSICATVSLKRRNGFRRKCKIKAAELQEQRKGSRCKYLYCCPEFIMILICPRFLVLILLLFKFLFFKYY